MACHAVEDCRLDRSMTSQPASPRVTRTKEGVNQGSRTGGLMGGGCLLWVIRLMKQSEQFRLARENLLTLKVEHTRYG